MIDPKASSIRMKAALSITAMVLAAVAAVFYFNGSWGQAPAVVAADIPVLASGQAMAPAALPWPDAPAAIRLQADDDLGSVVVRAAPNLPSIDAAKALAGQLAGIRVKRVWVQCKQDESDENEGGMIYFFTKRLSVNSLGSALEASLIVTML